MMLRVLPVDIVKKELLDFFTLSRFIRMDLGS